MNWKEELYRQAERAARSAWDEKRCIVKKTPRESTWYAIMLLDRNRDGDVQLPNRIFENLLLGTPSATHTLVSVGYAFLKYGNLLDETARARMREYIREAVPQAGTHDYTFGNVNHPLAGWLGILLAGKVLEEPLLCEIGWARVEKFIWWIGWQYAVERGMGTYSEFNSPTYSIINIMAASMAADVCPPGELRNRLIDLEGKFWLDLALYWHHPTHLLSGPHSRAYQEGCIGHGALVAFLMNIVSEGRAFIDIELPWDYDHRFEFSAVGALLSINFHIPPRARKILFEKQFPYSVRVNGYCKGWHYGTFVDDPNGSWLGKKGIRYAEMEHKFPAHYLEIKSYQTERFSLGTSSLQYCDGGQNNCFLLRYKRTEEIKRRGDTRSFYTRYLKNEKCQGEPNYYERENRHRSPTVLIDQGRVATFQNENKAIVLYRPREVENEGCSSLKLNLLMTYFQPFDELVVGNQIVETFPYDFDWRETLFLHDGGVFLAIQPLEPVNMGYQTACRLTEERDHLVLSIYNYQGEKRDFTSEEMFTLHNGFVCEVGQVDSFENLAAFQQHIASTQINEHRDGTLRDVTYTSGKDTLRVAFDAHLEQFRHLSVNGKYEYPERMHVTMRGVRKKTFCPERIWQE